MATHTVVDWKSPASHWRVPPGLSSSERSLTKDAQRRTAWVKAHIWIASSGTTRAEGFRWVGLSKAAFLVSAGAVNAHLQASRRDVWINVLPTYHVGGLSIFARAYLSTSRVIDHSKRRWHAAEFIRAVEKSNATLASLVPTQVFDLVETGAGAPSSLRAIVVGGGALDPKLYDRARKLGWPLLPSYGLTECCSQVATAELESLRHTDFPRLKILSHIQLEAREERLAIRSASLANYLASLHPERGFSLEDPCPKRWFVTEDLGEVRREYVDIQGRCQERVKILGELVSLRRIEEELRARVKADVCVFALPDKRRGNVLIAAFEKPASLQACRRHLKDFQKKSPALWRLANWYAVEDFPRSTLGKIQKAKLQAYLGLT